MTSCKVWNYCGTRWRLLETFHCKIWGSDCQVLTILERNTSFSDRDSGAILLAFKLSIHGWQALNTSRQSSCDLVSVLRSLVSYTLPRLLSFLGRHYSCVLWHFRKATWLDHQPSGRGNENVIGCSPDQIFPCGEIWSGSETLSSPTLLEGWRGGGSQSPKLRSGLCTVKMKALHGVEGQITTYREPIILLSMVSWYEYAKYRVKSIASRNSRIHCACEWAHFQIVCEVVAAKV